jgi:predicted SAM-dependent methyltransferase
VLDVSTAPWPWLDGSADEIEAFHLIEHLDGPRGKSFVCQCFHVLRPGGRLVLECPDLEAVCALYATDPARATLSLFGHQNRGRSMRHRYGYSRSSLAALLTEVGFHVEHVSDGTDYHAAEEPCLRIEARKW